MFNVRLNSVIVGFGTFFLELEMFNSRLLGFMIRLVDVRAIIIDDKCIGVLVALCATNKRKLMSQPAAKNVSKLVSGANVVMSES